MCCCLFVPVVVTVVSILIVIIMTASTVAAIVIPVSLAITGLIVGCWKWKWLGNTVHVYETNKAKQKKFANLLQEQTKNSPYKMTKWPGYIFGMRSLSVFVYLFSPFHKHQKVIFVTLSEGRSGTNFSDVQGSQWLVTIINKINEDQNMAQNKPNVQFYYVTIDPQSNKSEENKKADVPVQMPKGFKFVPLNHNDNYATSLDISLSEKSDLISNTNN